MHSDYLNPILKQLRDQQVRFAPRDRKIEQVNRAERLLSELDPRRTYTYEYLCYRHHRFSARVVSAPESHRRSRRPRPAAVRRRPVGRGQCACRIGRRARAHRRGAEQAVQGFDQDDLPLAPARAGEPPLRVRRPQASRLFDKARSSSFVARNEERVRRGAQFQPTDQRPSATRSSSGPGVWRGRRLPGRRHPAHRHADEPQRRDDSLHAQAV